jgi:hypothetical protein
MFNKLAYAHSSFFLKKKLMLGKFVNWIIYICAL